VARHFFALWPAEDAAERLARLTQEIAGRTGGRAVPAANIHLTLAFLGELEPARVAAARDVADGARGAAFSIRLDTLGAFRRAGVAWITDASPDARLLALQGTLDARLRQAGFALEERPFNPHVTLARRTQSVLAREAVDPIGWRVTEFALVRSDPGSGRYLILGSWPLDP
jgi:RNA 2',3'-cyclic 3'-phosphodiesterase